MEWGIVAAVAAVLIIFGGAKKLPEIARSVGRAQGEFKKGLREGAVPEADEHPESAKPSEPKSEPE
jgi:TatA/E family protein of Tat protein translocase